MGSSLQCASRAHSLLTLIALASAGCSLATDLGGFSDGAHEQRAAATETAIPSPPGEQTIGGPGSSDSNGSSTPGSPNDPAAASSGACPNDMVYVPAGSYVRGASAQDPDADDDELPRHNVQLEGFCIDRTEVSVAAYRACVDRGACEPPDRTTAINANCNYTMMAGGNEEMPVTCVNWSVASAYCKWEGNGQLHSAGPRRLPTEAEWEIAASGGKGQRFPWGDSDPSCERANFDVGYPGGYCRPGNSVTVAHAFSVNALSPSGNSPFGAAQMAGNVSEWTSDWYDATYYTSACSQGCSSPLGPNNGSQKVVRGGSWFNAAWRVRTSYRGMLDPTDSAPETGFRCASRPR